MAKLPLHKLLNRRVLVTRESAHALGAALSAALDEQAGGLDLIELDFDQIEAVTPSFVDEILGVIDDLVQESPSVKVVFLNAPTRLSEKFAAIGRARSLDIREDDPSTWSITRRISAA